MKVFGLFLLLIVVVLDGALCFAPPRPLSRAHCSVVPSMAGFSPDGDTNTNDSTEKGSPKKGLTPIQEAFSHITSLTSYMIMLFSGSVFFGLALNMVGLAYQFSWDHGMEIETIGKMREINQFRAEVNHRPPSALPK